MAYNRCAVTLTIDDAYGRSKTKQVEMVTTDATQAELDAQTIENAYSNVINGFIRKAQVLGLLEYSGAAAAGSNVDTGVTVRCQLSGRAEKAALKWPCPDPAIINGDGTLDLTDLGVLQIESLYQATGTNVARLSDGESIDGFLSGQLDK